MAMMSAAVSHILLRQFGLAERLCRAPADGMSGNLTFFAGGTESVIYVDFRVKAVDVKLQSVT